jgi:hypothetical protein
MRNSGQETWKLLALKHKRAAFVAARLDSGSFLLLFFLDLEDLAALIVTTAWAHGVREPHGAAIRTYDEIEGLKRIVGSPAVTATL